MTTRDGDGDARFVDFARPAIGESEIGEAVAALESGVDRLVGRKAA
jgi:hypothetical protein